jgi:hypothetical protein
MRLQIVSTGCAFFRSLELAEASFDRVTPVGEDRPSDYTGISIGNTRSRLGVGLILGNRSQGTVPIFPAQVVVAGGGLRDSPGKWDCPLRRAEGDRSMFSVKRLVRERAPAAEKWTSPRRVVGGAAEDFFPRSVRT